MTEGSDEDGGVLLPEIRAMMGVFALYWTLDRVIDETVAGLHLSRTENHLVIRLGRPRRMGELARMMMTVPSAVTAAADRLEEMGLVRRARDPQDRRAWLLRLTEAGRTHRQSLERHTGAMFKQVSGLSEAEIKEFARLAGKIHETVMQSGDLVPPEGAKRCV